MSTLQDSPTPTLQTTQDGETEEEPFIVGPCDVGRGLFASRVIERGEVILEFHGARIDFAETKRRGAMECMAIQVAEGTYIDTQPPGVLANHSCDPNTGIIQDRYLVALRHIRKGEEIRFDYSTTMEEQSFTMKCLCGSPFCRGMVRDFSTLPRPLQERYIAQGAVMSFILAKVKAAPRTAGCPAAR